MVNWALRTGHGPGTHPFLPQAAGPWKCRFPVAWSTVHLAVGMGGEQSWLWTKVREGAQRQISPVPSHLALGGRPTAEQPAS